MIEISHAQARRLIRLELDRPIPEEQWNTLQAHLERCPECLAYRRQCSVLEKDLQRGLQARWPSVKEPDRPLAVEILNFRARRAARWRFMRYAGLVVLLALLLSGGAVYYRASRPLPSAAAVSTGAGVSMVTPTRPVGPAFNGLVTFTAAPDGVPHVFLLVVGPAGPELDDLTPGPDRATDPAWSPDGQWIAFLSDRDRPGRGSDIYLINLAGTRLTRLTADENINWSGPLSWSPDGSTIAAVGTRRSGDSVSGSLDSWIYLVSWDGNPPRLLPQTHGARLPRFAPRGRRMAYQAPIDDTSANAYGVAQGASKLYIYDDAIGLTVTVEGKTPGAPLFLGENARFTWSPDASALLFIDQNPLPEPYVPAGVAEMRVTTGLDYVLENPLSDKHVAPSARVMAYSTDRAGRAVAWSSSGRLLLLEPIEDPGGQPGASVLSFYLFSFLNGMENPSNPIHSQNLNVSPTLFVHGSLSGANVQANWLVLTGRTAEDSRMGIYALYLPDRLEGGRAARLTRLLDLPNGTGDLQVRPSRTKPAGEGPGLTIDPVAARPKQVSGVPAVAPAELLSRVWGALPGNAGLINLRPDGSGWVQVSHYPGYCPRVSPDGRRVAFVAARPGDSARNVIYLMDADGQNLQQLTHTQDFPNPTIHRAIKAIYDCPTWSPDGTLLAAWLDTEENEYLAVLPADPGGEHAADAPSLTRYFSLISTGSRAAPQWSSDSKHVVLSIQTENYYSPSIVAQDVQSGEISRLQRSDGWHSVGSIALSSQPGWLAYTALSFTEGFGFRTELRVLGVGEGPFVRAVDPGAVFPWAANIPVGPLAWRGASLQLPQPQPLSSAVPGVARPSGSPNADSPKPGYIGFSLLGGPRPHDRASLMVYDIASNRLLTLLSIQEELRAAAWSPDGNWVIYATDSGVWILNVPGALAGQAAPAWLGNEQVEDLDWH